MKSNGLAWLGAAIALSAQVPAMAAEAPDSADLREIDALTEPFIKGLTGGDAKGAIATLFSHSAIMQSKTADISFLGAQAEAAIGAYGPIRACILNETKNSSRWSLTRLYICQHDKFLTRWLITMFKAPGGWQAATIRFDDKFGDAIGE
ncbi:MAG: hypothetical protein M0R03_10840 [Novosphingobium sp.]|nr:hypothetical protein [Novosphingobium sp.]